MEVEKGSEFTNRGSIFKQMAEMKKKIQLVEGKTICINENYFRNSQLLGVLHGKMYTDFYVANR